MPSFLTFDSVSAATPERGTLFSDLSISIGAERVGLVGRNGSGKSTLLRIAAGVAEPAGGHVRRPGTAATLAQDWPVEMTVAEALGVAEPLAVLARVLAGTGGASDLDRADWGLEARVEAALADVGLPSGLDLARPMGSLSGGERTRIGVARLRIEAPDLLLLDEPTNNLDAAGRAAVAALIADWRGGVLVASHDRALLEAMDRIVELTPVGIRIVGGGWSVFAALREAERAGAAAALDRGAADLRATRLSVQRERERKDRRDKAGRAFAARGSEPKILLDARAERAEATGGRASRLAERRIGEAEERAREARARVEVLTPLAIELPSSGLGSYTEVLSLNGVTLAAGDRLLGPWTLALRGPERVAIRGANGAGKTSLLRIAAGLAEPAGGEVRRAAGRIAYLDQHVGLLDPAASILDNLRRLQPALSEREAHAACARFAFRNKDALRPAASLSGGERLRAGLACALSGSEPAGALLLDEPTNHLDVEAVEILEAALAGFDGALLVVSHDAAFLSAIGIGRFVDLAPGSRENSARPPDKPLF